MTESEGKIWNIALRKDAMWYRFLRQKRIGRYILDFYCDRLKLWIEIDDNSHDMKWRYDEIRTRYLNSVWIQIIRYTNTQVDYNLDAVIMDLHIKLEERRIILQ